MNLSEFISFFRKENDRMMNEYAASILDQPAPDFEAYLKVWGTYYGLMLARRSFDEAVKKAYE